MISNAPAIIATIPIKIALMRVATMTSPRTKTPAKIRTVPKSIRDHVGGGAKGVPTGVDMTIILFSSIRYELDRRSEELKCLSSATCLVSGHVVLDIEIPKAPAFMAADWLP